jgi:phosphohistidine phosphatase
MREQAIAPDLVLCSTARRARETTERIQSSLGTAPVIHEPGLYGASATSLLERLRSVPDEIASVLIVGHNPAIGDLAVDLARPSPERQALAVKFPTASLAELGVPISAWRDLDHNRAELVAFIRPRDLEN